VKPVIAFRDYVQDGSFTGTFGTGQAPLAGGFVSLKSPQLADCAVWSSGLGSTIAIICTFEKPELISAICALDVRAKTALSVDTQYYAMDDSLLVFGPGFVGFQEYPNEGFLRHHHTIVPSPVMAKGIRVDSAMLSSTSLSIGRLWAGPTWEPSGSIDFDWFSDVEDRGEMGESRGGQGFPRPRQKRRILGMNLGAVPYEDAYGNEADTVMDLQQLGFEIGTTSPIIALPRTRKENGDIDTHAIHRLGTYGHLTNTLKIQHAKGNFFKTSMNVRELL
jgi:hypothetical protein